MSSLVFGRKHREISKKVEGFQKHSVVIEQSTQFPLFSQDHDHNANLLYLFI